MLSGCHLQTNFESGVDVEGSAPAQAATRRLSTLPKDYLLTHPCMDPRVNDAKVG
jgi:hypothetical protein